MIPQAKMSELKKIKAKGVKCRGPYQGRWFHVGIAFECEDMAAVMRLGAAIAKAKTLSPLLEKEIHTDDAGRNILVSFHALHLHPDGSKSENDELMEMLENAYEAQSEWEEQNKGRL